jgi:cholesterol oxidase
MWVRLSSPIESIKAHYNVVVVGSGYGGGIAASRMSRAGQSVCILERGKEMQPGDYPDTANKATANFQVTAPDAHIGDRTGMFDMHVNDDMAVFVGCGLGGTSLVNANVALRAEPRVFDDARWPQAFRNDASTLLRDSYTRAEEMLKPNAYPPSRSTAKLRALEKSAKAMGLGNNFYRPPINVNFLDKTAGNHVGVSQPACNDCGDCCGGCNVGAKNTTLMNYIPDAWNHGAEIFTRCSVRFIERTAGGKWAVHFQALNTGREAFDAPTMFVTADVVVLSAGTLGSTEILLRSKQRGLASSDRIGRGFTGNGDVLAFGYNTDTECNGIGFGAKNPKTMEPVGPCITGIIDLRDRPKLEDGMVLEEGSIPGAVAALAPLTFQAAAAIAGNQHAKNPAQLIREAEREAESVFEGAYKGATRNMQTFLVMSQDDGNGVVVLENDRAVVKWPGVGNQPNYVAANDNLDKATSALGNGYYLPNPFWTQELGRKLITVHPLGGCCMGEDATTGVVNHKGQVFAGNTGTDVYEGLYVSDGAVIPRPLGVNPLLTISATAERSAFLMAQDRGWKIDYTLPSAPRLQPKKLPVGVEFTETMKGYFLRGATDYQQGADGGKAAQSPLQFTLTVVAEDLDLLVSSKDHPAQMVGTVNAPMLSAKPLQASEGEFGLFVDDPTQVQTRHMTYKMKLTSEEGETYYFDGFKKVDDAALIRVWPDTSTLYITISDANHQPIGRGILHIEPADFAVQMTTMRVINAPTEEAKIAALAKFGKFFSGILFRDYGGVLTPPTLVDTDAAPRKKRELRVGAPEVHFFEALIDKVPLRLTRYRGGAKGPVILSHGLGVSSQIFSIDTIDTNMLEYLYAHGYDVWLLDYRASIDLPSAKEQFSGDDIANRDYPAAVDEVRRLTGAPTVQMVVHCFGSSTFFMSMASGLQGVRSAVASQVALHVDAGELQKIRCTLHTPTLLRHLGFNDLDAIAKTDEGFFERIYDRILSGNAFVQAQGRCNSAVCHRITFMYAPLYEHVTLNDPTHTALGEMFGVANMKSFEHLALTVQRGHAVTADDRDAYMPHADRIKIPIKFISGANNACYLPSSTEKTYDLLRKVNGEMYSRDVIPGYGHIDCIFGKNAVKDVFPKVLAHLEATL